MRSEGSYENQSKHQWRFKKQQLKNKKKQEKENQKKTGKKKQ